MPPENPTVADPAEPVSAEAPAVAAPRREKRLTPVAPAPKRLPAAARAAVRAPVAPAGVPPTQASAVESKVAALKDPEEMLNVMRTEAALRRAQRLSGAGDAQRQTIRMLSVFMLFALLVAGLGAMWYLQTSLEGSRHSAHRPPMPVQGHATTGH